MYDMSAGKAARSISSRRSHR